MDTLEQPPSEQPGAAEPPRRLGRLLSDSLDLAFERFGRYAGVVAAGILPGVLLVGLGMWALGFTGEESIRAAMDAGQYGEVFWLAALGMLGLFCKGLAFLALAAMLIARSDGGELAVGDAFNAALGFLLPLLAAEALVFLWVVGGLLLLIVPGLILAIRYSLTHWAVLVEHRSGSAALARSREIMLAHMGKVVGNLVVSGLLVALAAITVSVGLILLLALAGVARPEPGALAHTLALRALFDLVKGAVGIWGIAFSILLYKDLAALHPQPQGA